MAGKSLGQRARLLLLLRLYLLEERSEGLRIVTGLIHVLQAQMVGLSLEAAREFHEAQRHDKAGGRARGIAGAAAHKDQREVGNIGPFAARLLAGPVAGPDDTRRA